MDAGASSEERRMREDTDSTSQSGDEAKGWPAMKEVGAISNIKGKTSTLIAVTIQKEESPSENGLQISDEGPQNKNSPASAVAELNMSEIVKTIPLRGTEPMSVAKPNSDPK